RLGRHARFHVGQLGIGGARLAALTLPFALALAAFLVAFAAVLAALGPFTAFALHGVRLAGFGLRRLRLALARLARLTLGAIATLAAFHPLTAFGALAAFGT
ncbi:hypothetical protein, partial [Burkholderia cenocepacia]|uniref:hypothetical protein n=1 Tax=Burkholderia cenocepacia TaxID=95486 RepID=UPI00222F0B29